MKRADGERKYADFVIYFGKKEHQLGRIWSIDLNDTAERLVETSPYQESDRKPEGVVCSESNEYFDWSSLLFKN